MKQSTTSNTWPTSAEPHLTPLFPPGLHRLDQSALFNRTVAAFPLSSRRQMIWDGFLRFSDDLARWPVTGEIWLDGSFTTNKVDPDDADLVILFDREPLLQMTRQGRGELKTWLDSKPFLKANYHCDVYYIASDNVDRCDYWSRWYGHCEDRRTPKGIPIMRIHHG